MLKLQLENDKRLVSALLALMLVPICWFLVTDLLAYDGDWPRLRARLIARGFSLLIPVVGFLLVRVSRTSEALSRAVFGIATALAAILLSLNLLRPQGTMLPMRTPFMALVIMYGAMPNTAPLQIIPPILYSLGIAAERAFWLTDSTAGDMPSDLLIMAFVNAVGIYMVIQRRRLETEIEKRMESERRALETAEQSLADLRTLRGIIPICSYCKKIRTKIGDWEQIEHYVNQHTHAEFSHGICPDCLPVQFPSFKQPEI